MAGDYDLEKKIQKPANEALNFAKTWKSQTL